MLSSEIVTHILFHVGENGLEGWSGIGTELPASLNDAPQSVAGEEREGLQETASHAPDHAFPRHVLEWLPEENELVEEGTVREGEESHNDMLIHNVIYYAISQCHTYT